MSFEIACRKVYETEDAVLVHDLATEEDVWFPFSQVEEMHFGREKMGSIVVTDWIAKQKGYDA